MAKSKQEGLGDALLGTRLGETSQSRSTAPAPSERRGGDLFIVDNSDEEWKVRDYLSEWADIASAFDEEWVAGVDHDRSHSILEDGHASHPRVQLTHRDDAEATPSHLRRYAGR